MSNKKGPKVPYAEIARLLVQLQERADGAVKNQVLLRASVNDSLFVAHSKINENYSEQRQKNKDFTDSLYKLRESTGKAFDGVSTDVKNIVTSIQRLNERLGQVESQNIALVSTIAPLNTRLSLVETRLKVLESYKQFLEDAFKGKSE